MTGEAAPQELEDDVVYISVTGVVGSAGVEGGDLMCLDLAINHPATRMIRLVINPEHTGAIVAAIDHAQRVAAALREKAGPAPSIN